MTAPQGYLHDDKIRSLQRSLYRAAKANPRRAFHQLYDHVTRTEVLWASWRQVRRNGGAGGIDRRRIGDFENVASEEIARLRTELRDGTYRPAPVRRVHIPKSATETRPLGIPTIRDRIVQGAVKLVLEPVLDARFYEHSYGFRPRRSAHRAVELVGKLVNSGYRHVLDLDIRRYFDQVPHGKLLLVLRQHVSDPRLLRLVKKTLKAPIMEPNGVLKACRKGCPQGGPLSPLIANLYLDVLDRWLAKRTRYKDVVWVRYADDGVLLSRRPVQGLRERIAQVLGRLELEMHPEKTRIVDMGQHGTLDFLGYRLARRPARGRPGSALLIYPGPKAQRQIRTTVRSLIPSRGNADPKWIARRVSQTLRGWVEYFRLSTRKLPSQTLTGFVFRRLRRYTAKQRRTPGHGTRKFPDQWLRERLGILDPYHHFVELRFSQPNAAR